MDVCICARESFTASRDTNLRLILPPPAPPPRALFPSGDSGLFASTKVRTSFVEYLSASLKHPAKSLSHRPPLLHSVNRTGFLHFNTFIRFFPFPTLSPRACVRCNDPRCPITFATSTEIIRKFNRPPSTRALLFFDSRHSKRDQLLAL